jgi:hypothetical protein
VTPFWVHLFWGAVVYLSALQIARGVAAAGEWVAKARMKDSELRIAFERETRALRGREK